MKIDCFVLGEYETNCYVLRGSDAGTDCLIIDAGLDASKLVSFLKDDKLSPLAVVLTHGHIDHITGVVALCSEFPDIKVCIHKLDSEMLAQPEQNLSAFAGISFTMKPADHILEDGDMIEQAGIKLRVLHTPGHTPGGISLYSEREGIVFVGDALFADSVGRTDFPGGSMAQLIGMIRDKLLTLPDDTVVHPGHGPATKIIRERLHNPFLT